MSNETTGSKSKTKYIVFLSLGIIFIALAPFLFTRHSWWEALNFTETGAIGDTIGGITAPFLSILGSILVYLAFKEQIKANELLKGQFIEQQFESQFYEMLKLHKENVNEITFEFPLDFKKFSESPKREVSGREAFKLMEKHFFNILLCSFQNSNIEKSDYENAYKLFFWGHDEGKYLSIEKKYSISKEAIIEVDGDLVKNQCENLLLDLTCKHDGYASGLAHYYRHLYFMVKFVVESAIHDKKRKYYYLKLIRAQLSNPEQSMLFYNSLCDGYGSAWEENLFFSKYKMIHNIWEKNLYNNSFIVDEINGLIERYNSNNPNTKKALFEFQEDRPEKLMRLDNKNAYKF